MVEEEIVELTEKQQEFLRIIELVKPSRFMTGVLSWCGLGRRLKKREYMLRAYFLKSVYDLPILYSMMIGIFFLFSHSNN